jgi:hypothetical protein
MPKNMPTIDIDSETAAPQRFENVKHAQRVDGTRGVTVRHSTGPMSTDFFMDYTQAVRLHEALGAALAFLDEDERDA